jgi:UDP-3-O-[3-hydroxymyristoyl] N-acetylglucosamine deacetylase
MKQKTIARSFTLKGLGLHSGQPAEVTVAPAPVDTGILFLVGGEKVPASLESLAATRRGTSLEGVAVVEHFLSAAFGLNIDNLAVSVSGPELPIVDGSALPFAQAMIEAGIVEQSAEKRFIELLKEIELSEKSASLAARPYHGFQVEFMVKFEGFGEQSLVFDPERQSYIKEIAPARTFGYLEEAEELKHKGLALGASLENALVLSKNGYVNQPRFADELVRHKILDLIGDLALLGSPLHAAIKANCSGHKLNTDLVRRLLTND